MTINTSEIKRGVGGIGTTEKKFYKINLIF